MDLVATEGDHIIAYSHAKPSSTYHCSDPVLRSSDPGR